MLDPEFDRLPTVSGALDDAARGAEGITFVSPRQVETTLTYADLRAEARAVAAALAERGVGRGERVVLILPDEREFVTVFFGVVTAGAVAVPVAPPAGMRRLGSFLSASTPLVRKSRACLVVTSPALRATLGTLRDVCPELRGIAVASELAGGSSVPDPGLTLDDPALLQFTSGSTSDPKGVVLTHGNLAANAWVINHDGLRREPGDRAVSWLPLFHDMGLIGFVVTPLYAGIPATLLSPLSFLRRPAVWLETLARHRGTITYAPNFAYGFAAKRIRDEQVEGLDLGHVRVLGCGAEPIHAGTLRRFARRFARLGISERAFYPSYGMAESCLAVSFGRGLPVDRVVRTDLAARGEAVRANGEDPDATLELVGCGEAFVGHELRVVDPETGAGLPDRSVGEIRIKGPSVTRGYFEALEETAELFDEDGWLRTGDLGYLDGGTIYPCGRIKDLIIVRGRNYYPQDIEWAAASADGVRTGCVAAFARRTADGRDEVVLVAEIKPGHDESEVAGRMRSAVREACGLPVGTVRFVERNTLPKTSSGKLQRAAVRRLVESGRWRDDGTEGALQSAGRVLGSQLAHWRHRLFERGA